MKVDDIISKYKQYLTNAQIKALVEESEKYKALNTRNRAAAYSNLHRGLSATRRGLQNVGLAGRVGNLISGQEEAAKTRAQEAYDEYNNSLKRVDSARVEARAAQYANDTIRARNEAAQKAAEEEAERLRQEWMAQQKEESKRRKQELGVHGQMTDTGGGVQNRADRKPMGNMSPVLARQLGQTADTGGSEEGAARNRLNRAMLPYRQQMQAYREVTSWNQNEWNRQTADGGDNLRSALEQPVVSRFFANNVEDLQKFQTLSSNERTMVIKSLQKAYAEIDENGAAWQEAIDAENNYNGKVEQQNIPGHEKTTTLTGNLNEEEKPDWTWYNNSYDKYKETHKRPYVALNKNDPIVQKADKARRAQASAISKLYHVAASLDMTPEQRKYMLMTDDQFDVSYDAALKAYEQASKNMSNDTAAAHSTRAEQARTEYGFAKTNYESELEVATGVFANLEYVRQVRRECSPDALYWSSYENDNQDFSTNAFSRYKADGTWHITKPDLYKSDDWHPEDYDNEHGTTESKYAAIVNESSYMIPNAAWNFSYGKTIWNFSDFFLQFGKERTYNKDLNMFLKKIEWEKGDKIVGNANNKTRKDTIEAVVAAATKMTQAERRTYNSILATEGAEKADEYFEWLKPELTQRLLMDVDEINDEVAKAGNWLDKVVMSAISVPTNIMQGMVNPAQTMFSKGDASTESLMAARRNSASRYRESMMKDMATAGRIIYGTLMSMADSATVALISGGLGKIFTAAGMPVKIAGKAGSAIGGSLLGGSAFNSSYDEALRRGLSPDKARLTAVGNGINEMLFETVSLDLLVGQFRQGGIIKAAKNGLVNWAVNTLVSAGVEGSEEVFTDIANKWWDNHVNGIFSEELRSIRDDMSNGMSYADAKAKAQREFAAQLGESFLGGAISGGVMGGGSTFMGMVQNRGNEKVGKGLRQNSRVMNELRNFDFKSEYAQEILHQKNLTNADVADLFNIMQQELLGQYKSDIQKAVADGKITQEQADLLKQYEQNGVQIVKDGNVVDNADGITVEQMPSVQDAIANLDNAARIQFLNNEEMRSLVQAVGGKTAAVIEQSETAERDAEKTYQQTVREINNDTTLSPELKQKRLEAAERTRQNARSEASKIADTALTNKKGIGAKLETDGNGTVKVGKGSGNVTYDFSTKDNPGHQTVDSMTATEQSALRIAKVVAASRGDVNVKVEAEFVGEHANENGYYDRSTNTIHINMSGDNSVLWTLSHELTHHLANTDTEAYAALRTAIETALKDSKLTTTELEDRGFEYDLDRVDPYIDREGNLWDALVSFEREEHGYGKDAEEEVVARCCESFLGFDQFVKDFARKQYKSAKAINKFIAQMNIDMQRVSEDARQSAAQRNVWNDESPENQILRQLTEIDRIANLWRIAVNAEAKKRQAAREETRASTKDSVKRSDAEYLDLARRYESGDKSVEAELRKAVDAAAKANGYMPVARFHQTKTAFNRFSTDNPVAGLHDSETPNGIFLKTNDHDIGIGGSIQMPLYLESGNYLHFLNRKEANAWYCKNVQGYESLQNEMESKLKEFEDRIAEIEKQEFDPSKTDEEVDKLFEEEQRIIDEMRPVENEYRMRLRELLNQYFLNGKHHYDGIELDYDGHRWVNGKRENVHTFIAFRSNQVKSADLVTYDNNGNIIPLSERFNTENEDIRYSVKDDVKQTDITEYEHFNEEKYANMSETERIEYREHIAEMQIRKEARERQRAIDRNRRIRRDLTAMLKRGNDRIVKLLANPTENSHVPVQLAQAVAEYAQRLNELLVADVNYVRDNPPSVEDVKAYIDEHGYNVDANRFVDFYTERGWLANSGLPMTNWKLNVASWAKRGEPQNVSDRQKTGAEKIIDALNRSYADEETIAALKAEDPKFDPRGLLPVQYDENGHIIKDETLVKMIKGMDSIIQGKHMKDLTEEELRFVLNTMRGVIHIVTEANKVTVQGEQRNVYRESRQMANEVNSATKVFGDKSNKITKFMNRYVIESLGLRRIAKLYSGSDENAVFVKMVDDLNEGALEQERIKQTLRGMFNEVTSKYAKEMDTWYGKKAEWIDTGLGFKITKGMRVSLAMHILNAQNLRNVEKAGLRIPDMAAYRKGNIKEAYKNGKVFRLTKAQAEQIVANMTDAEKAYFDVAKEFFHKRAGFYINRTSLKLLGYSKAVVKNYFPIQTDDAYRTVKYDDVRQTAAVEHPGFLEARKGTANVMYLNDITAVVNRQIDGVAKYAGLAIPMRNWNNIMNAWLFEENADGEWVRSDEGRAHDVLERRMGYTGKGKAIIDYVDQFITDLTSPGIRDANENVHAAEFAAKITSNYVKAVLTLNARVALSQLASVPTATAEIPWKYIVQSFGGNVEGHLNRNASNELIDQYTPIFAMRRAGTQTEVSEVMKRRGFADKAEQKLPGLLGWITGMDVAATRRLWYACERWVKGETEIPVGSDAFYKEVARRYNRVIQNTQPNFTVLQRSPALRSKNAAARIITMFGTQRMQNAGVFIESLAEVVQTKDKAKRKVAMKKFGRTLSGLITAAIVIGLERALVSAIRGRMRPLQDDDKDITAGSVSKYIIGETGKSLAGSFMYVGEIYDIVNGVVGGLTDGDYGYDDSFALPAAEALSTIIKFVKEKDWQYFAYMSGDHTDHEKWLKTRSFVNELMTVASYATGLPLANASKTILNGTVPLVQDIVESTKTGELNLYLHQSGKLDNAKTAANYKEWTNLGKKGNVYLYWEKKLKETGSYTDEEGDEVKQRTARAEELRKDNSLTNDERAMLLRMVTTGATSDGSVVYNENGKIIVDFTNEWRYKASLYTKRESIAEALWHDTTASPEEKAKLMSLMADGEFDVDGAVVYTMTKNDEGEMERNNVVVDFTNLDCYRASTMLSDKQYEGFLNLVDMGVAEDVASTAFIQYNVQKKQSAKANDRFRDWLFKTVKSPEDRAKVDMSVIGNTVRVEGTIGYKENGEVYADYSSKEMFDLYTNGKKQEKSDAIISTTDTPEAKAKAFADTDNNYHAKGGIVYNDKDKVVADFTSDEAYRASQMGESHYGKYTEAVKQGMTKENAILAVEKHKEFTDDDDKDNATQYATWVFNTYKNARDRAIAGAIYTTKPVTVKDGRTYDENGYIYRDYTSAAWYKLSNRTLSKDGVNKRYEAAKILEKDGYTAEKTVAAYVELDKLSKKSEWQDWLKAHGYTNYQIEIILWSRGWAKMK